MNKPDTTGARDSAAQYAPADAGRENSENEWTRDLPARPGHYWHVEPRFHGRRIMMVYPGRNDELAVMLFGCLTNGAYPATYCAVRDMEPGWWLGPIADPGWPGE